MASKKKIVCAVRGETVRRQVIKIASVDSLTPNELRALSKLLYAFARHLAGAGGKPVSDPYGAVLYPSPGGTRYYHSLWKKGWAVKVALPGQAYRAPEAMMYGYRLTGLHAAGVGLRLRKP